LQGQELAARHIALREQAGLTQEQEAKAAGVSPTTISGIESGKITRPHLKTLLKIARALGADVGELRESGKAGAPPSREPSLFNGLEEERRRAELEEIRESYRETQEGLARYCDSWEQRIAAGDLKRESVQGFLEAADPLLPALIDSVVSELVEISRVVSDVENDSVSDDVRAEASVKPVLDRYHAIGRKLQVMWQEQFAGAQSAKATVDDTVSNFLDYKEAKLRAAVNKKAASG
jgi:transcriptional regulator with XRE-family HTH domain